MDNNLLWLFLTLSVYISISIYFISRSIKLNKIITNLESQPSKISDMQYEFELERML